MRDNTEGLYALVVFTRLSTTAKPQVRTYGPMSFNQCATRQKQVKKHYLNYPGEFSCHLTKLNDYLIPAEAPWN